MYRAPLAEIVERELWAPLGMTGEASWLQNLAGDRGVPIGYCCLQATSEDYARFGQFLLQNGMWNGARMLSEGFVERASTPNTPFQEPGATPYPGRGYGLHVWVPEDHDGEFYAAGVFGQYIWVDRRRGVVIAMNAGDPGFAERYFESAAVFRAIAEHVSPLVPRTGLASVDDDGEGGIEP